MHAKQPLEKESSQGKIDLCYHLLSMSKQENQGSEREDIRDQMSDETSKESKITESDINKTALNRTTELTANF